MVSILIPNHYPSITAGNEPISEGAGLQVVWKKGADHGTLP
jgi:hypothetical protein